MDDIQYTYKPCKLILMKSIHENKRCILETQSVKPKPKQNQNIYQFHESNN